MATGRSGMGRHFMLTFRVGEKVVYPNHGVGTIEQISSRNGAGAMEKYYLLRINASSLTVMVPFSNVQNVGLRKIVKQPEVERILIYLASGECETHADWKWRFKENSEKMRSGSLLQVAEVMKSLLKLNAEKPLSFREKKMLDRARHLLVSELATVKNLGDRQVEMLIGKALDKAALKLPELD
jgi:CarD family transcriptional regulator